MWLWDHEPCISPFMALVWRLQYIFVSCCSYSLRATTTATTISTSDSLEKFKATFLDPCWSDRYFQRRINKLCSFPWQTATITVAQSWNGQATWVQVEWIPHQSEHCGRYLHNSVHSNLLTGRSLETQLQLRASQPSDNLHWATYVQDITAEFSVSSC